MRRHRVAIATLVLLLGCAILFWILSSGSSSLGAQVRISVSDAAKGQVAISNRGPKTMHIGVSSQVFSNGIWHPPKEELYKHPLHVLGVKTASPEDSEDGSNSIRFEFPERCGGKLPWRVVVLCQKYYGEGISGQLNEFVERNLTMKDKFAKGDHRGSFDAWVFSERFDSPTTEQISREERRTAAEF